MPAYLKQGGRVEGRAGLPAGEDEHAVGTHSQVSWIGDGDVHPPLFASGGVVKAQQGGVPGRLRCRVELGTIQTGNSGGDLQGLGQEAGIDPVEDGRAGTGTCVTSGIDRQAGRSRAHARTGQARWMRGLFIPFSLPPSA
jgi:hypothetical protein